MARDIKSGRYNIYDTDSKDDRIEDNKARIGIEVNKEIMNEYQYIFTDIINIFYQTLSPNIITSDFSILAISVDDLSFNHSFPGNYAIVRMEGTKPVKLPANLFIYSREVDNNNREYYGTFIANSMPIGVIATKKIMIIDNLYDQIYELNRSSFLPIKSESTLIETGFHNYENEFEPLDKALLVNKFEKDIPEGLIDKNIDSLYVNKTYNDTGIVGGISIRYEDVGSLEGQWVKLGSTNDKLIPKYTQNIECTIINGAPLVHDNSSKSNKAFVIWIGADTFLDDSSYLFENNTIRYKIDYTYQVERDDIYNSSSYIIDYIPESIASTIKMGDILIKIPNKSMSNYPIGLMDKVKSFGTKNDPYLYIYINQYLKTSEYIDYDDYIDSEVAGLDYIYDKFDLLLYRNEYFISKENGEIANPSSLVHTLESNPGYKPFENTGEEGETDKELKRTRILINNEEIISGVINPLYVGDTINFTQITNSEISLSNAVSMSIDEYDLSYIANVNGYDDDGLYPKINQTASLIFSDHPRPDIDTKLLFKGSSRSIPSGSITVKEIKDGEFLRLRFFSQVEGSYMDTVVLFQMRYHPQQSS